MKYNRYINTKDRCGIEGFVCRGTNYEWLEPEEESRNVLLCALYVCMYVYIMVFILIRYCNTVNNYDQVDLCLLSTYLNDDHTLGLQVQII